MPIFVLMTRLAPEGLGDAETRQAMGEDWLEQVHGVMEDVG